ncbi:GspH/FimT family pseudopilin [Paucibacter sp. DJ1R-11]|uniref:GspH/FimT family pseudopilin n=1 Tax=Paucibacter sp. DJ1R-11 TaxID=2893556 RepID=UPI0021E36007|nr:GspH/FimT family pseudopilin [Paucibacter sp. DJ1R-11]MCV2365473.1 GspH/FimT family pseudopilin [Paucibacter sp. DJ1R-11]
MLKTARCRRAARRGFTLVELVVSLALLAIFMAVAAPNFSDWLANTRIRTAASAIANGLQLAKAEAVSRNTLVRFQLTSSLTNSCAIATTGTNWVVNMINANTVADSVAGQCAAAFSDSVAPRILHSRPAGDGSTGVQVNASVASLVFNGVGRLNPVPAADVTINVSPPSASGSCVSAGGDITCLRILISTAGQIRLCNPNLAAGDPQAC